RVLIDAAVEPIGKTFSQTSLRCNRCPLRSGLLLSSENHAYSSDCPPTCLSARYRDSAPITRQSVPLREPGKPRPAGAPAAAGDSCGVHLGAPPGQIAFLQAALHRPVPESGRERRLLCLRWQARLPPE